MKNIFQKKCHNDDIFSILTSITTVNSFLIIIYLRSYFSTIFFLKQSNDLPNILQESLNHGSFIDQWKIIYKYILVLPIFIIISILVILEFTFYCLFVIGFSPFIIPFFIVMRIGSWIDPIKIVLPFVIKYKKRTMITNIMLSKSYRLSISSFTHLIFLYHDFLYLLQFPFIGDTYMTA